MDRTAAIPTLQIQVSYDLVVSVPVDEEVKGVELRVEGVELSVEEDVER